MVNKIVVQRRIEFLKDQLRNLKSNAFRSDTEQFENIYEQIEDNLDQIESLVNSEDGGLDYNR